MCKDCKAIFQCEQCGHALTLHDYPTQHLLCHRCKRKINIPDECYRCHSTRIIRVGFGIQELERSLAKHFTQTPIARIDSDKKREEGIDIKEIKKASIVLLTELGNMMNIPNVGLVGFALVEAEVSAPRFDMEEAIYTNIRTNMKKGSDIVFQTYTPHSPILKLLTEENYKSFLIHTLEERKKFGYPPYRELLQVRVTDQKVSNILAIADRLAQKINLSITQDQALFYDRENLVREGRSYVATLTLKGLKIDEALLGIRTEIFRNRRISIERFPDACLQTIYQR
jgi:primosomal protein N' (replication factor Y)